MAESFDMNAAIIDPLAGLSEPIEKPADVVEKKEEVKPSLSPEIDNRLQQIQNSVQGNELLTKVLSIPGVQDLLKAHQAGQPFRVMTGNDVQPTAPAEPQIDWEKMKDDPQAMSQHIIKSISAELLPALDRSLTSKIQPLSEKIQSVENSISNQTASQVNKTIEEARKVYTDFDQMRPLMAKLNQEVSGGLNVDELYKLAKIRSGQPLVGQKEVETEKPTDNAARLPSQTQQKKYAPGRRGMKQAIADAVGSFDLDSMIQQ